MLSCICAACSLVARLQLHFPAHKQLDGILTLVIARPGGGEFNSKRVLTCATPCAQATIQGALGSLPLLLIQSSSTLKGKPNYQEYTEWGNDILHATAFAIIIAAPIGLLCIALLGPLWLSKASLALPFLHCWKCGRASTGVCLTWLVCRLAHEWARQGACGRCYSFT